MPLQENQNEKDARKLYEEGKKLYDSSVFKKAIQTLKASIKLNPNASAAYFLLGQVYFVRNRVMI